MTTRARIGLAAPILVLLVCRTAAQPALPKAPAAGTIRVDPPAGVDLTIPPVPAEPAFAVPKTGWWKAGAPCPRGRTPVRGTNKGSEDWARSLDCVRGDVPDGPFVLLRKDGSRFREGYAAAGKRHGLEREWFADGTPKHVAYYADGEPLGPYRSTFANKALDEEGAYLAGKKHGLWREGSDWGFVARGHYVRGEPEGRWVAELNSTTVVSIGFAKAQLHGEARLWRLTGEPLATGTFTSGDGAWTSYHRSGRRAATLSCKTGRLVDAAWFDEGDKKLDDLRSIDTRRLSDSERYYRSQLDHVCGGSLIVLFTSTVFAPDHGSGR